jgi:hypothetical protein
VSDIFLIAVCLNLFSFVYQTFFFFIPESYNSFEFYIVHIIFIVMAYILRQLHFSLSYEINLIILCQVMAYFVIRTKMQTLFTSVKFDTSVCLSVYM